MNEFEKHMIEKEIAGEEEKRRVVLEEALEAILFAAGHPITYATLARVFDLTPTKVKEYVMNYAEYYNHNTDVPRGVELLTFPDSCQLATKQHYLSEIRDTLGLKKTGTISTSSMETLAIVAYNQPVTRVFVDTLRRADSSYAMNNLLDRGLIECKGRLDVPGRPMLYGTTSDFLRCFGLHDLTELPQTTEELNAMFQKAQNTETPEESIEGGEQLNLFEDEQALQNADDTQNEEVETVTEQEEYYDEPSADDDIHYDSSDIDLESTTDALPEEPMISESLSDEEESVIAEDEQPSPSIADESSPANTEADIEE